MKFPNPFTNTRKKVLHSGFRKPRLNENKALSFHLYYNFQLKIYTANCPDGLHREKG